MRYCAAVPRRPDIADAIARGLAGTADGPCVPWPGALQREGHGVVGFRAAGKKRMTGAHRFVWLASGRVIPDGLTIDHACHDPLTCPGGRTCLHRRCVNVAHLRLATMKEQLANSTKLNRDTCGTGLHPWIDDNIYVDPTGRRKCRPCRILAVYRGRST